MLRSILIAATCLTLSTSGSDVFAQSKRVLPASDPSNEGNWRLNTDVSDEFDQPKIDTDKWLVQGTDGEYRSNWIGRAPSQFSTDNVRIEDGKLKLETRWEPDFDFSEKVDRSDATAKNGRVYENVTTAAVISKRQFHYGYMEIKCKAADASITSSFWMTGHKSELDVFEFLGAPAQKHKKHLETEFKCTILDWGKPKGDNRRVWQEKHQLDWRVADDFHVYGCDWRPQGMKFYADGKQIGVVSSKKLGEKWVLKHPLWVWVDSETFPWSGLPIESDLPADFEIEYIRIWQRH